MLWEKWKPEEEDRARIPPNGENVDFPETPVLALNASQYDDMEC